MKRGSFQTTKYYRKFPVRFYWEQGWKYIDVHFNNNEVEGDIIDTHDPDGVTTIKTRADFLAHVNEYWADKPNIWEYLVDGECIPASVLGPKPKITA